MLPARTAYPAFQPAAPWIGADLQTLKDFILRPRIRLDDVAAGQEKLELPMPDGSGDRLVASLAAARRPRDGAPMVVLIHGLTGTEDSVYVRRSARHFLAAGHPVARLNLRGAGPSRSLCRGNYHAGRGEDLKAVLEHLLAAGKARRFALVGFSLGGNMLLKFLAEHGGRLPIGAAVSVSAPIDLAVAAERFLQPRNRFYHAAVLHKLKQDVLVAPGLEGGARRAAENARTLVEFDDRFVAPANGFAGARDYYARCSALRYLPGIPVPTLLLHALDDPWIPGRTYLSVDWGRLPALTPVLPLSGGHVGFHNRGGVWSDVVAASFIGEHEGRT